MYYKLGQVLQIGQLLQIGAKQHEPKVNDNEKRQVTKETS